jgi:hypothetical protein
MEQQSLPLKDIHLPSTVSWWPLAPGWWMIIVLALLILMAWRFRRQIRAWLAPGIRSIALSQLDKIANNRQLNNQQKVQCISQLLRQSAISSASREQVAGLAGDQWLEFLDGDNPEQPFSKGVGRSLIDAPYLPDTEVDVDSFLNLAINWLKENTGRRDY